MPPMPCACAPSAGHTRPRRGPTTRFRCGAATSSPKATRAAAATFWCAPSCRSRSRAPTSTSSSASGPTSRPAISPASAPRRGAAMPTGWAICSRWLYSRIPASTGPVLTKGVIVPVAGGAMPVYWITDEKHPLYPAQQDGGMSAEEVWRSYAILVKTSLSSACAPDEASRFAPRKFTFRKDPPPNSPIANEMGRPEGRPASCSEGCRFRRGAWPARSSPRHHQRRDHRLQRVARARKAR